MQAGPVHVDIWDLLKLLSVGLVVRAMDGSICTVEGFDITKSRYIMPVKLKRIFNNTTLECTLPDITAVLVPVDHQEPGGRK